MNATKQKAVDFAKNLYLEVNDKGEKAYSCEYIAIQLQKKCKFECNQSTVYRWAKKNDWDGLFEKIKMAGIEKGKESIQQKENQLIDEKSQIIADIYQSNKKIQSITQKTLLSRLTGTQLKDSNGNDVNADMGNSDLIRLLQHSEATLLELQDKRKATANNQNIDPFKRIRDNAEL